MSTHRLSRPVDVELVDRLRLAGRDVVHGAVRPTVTTDQGEMESGWVVGEKDMAELKATLKAIDAAALGELGRELDAANRKWKADEILKEADYLQAAHAMKPIAEHRPITVCRCWDGVKYRNLREKAEEVRGGAVLDSSR